MTMDDAALDELVRRPRPSGGNEMNNLPLRDAVRRANSHFRYWQYRRTIGNAYPLRVAIREWFVRVWFEWSGKP